MIKMNKNLFCVCTLLIFCACVFAQTENSSSIQKFVSENPDFLEFFNLYNTEIYNSHAKLTLMHKKNNLSKLGKESVQGSLSGTLSYKTSLKGFNGVVTMEYKNYSDNPDFVFNGFMNTRANICANGRMFGTVVVSGKFNAKISYDNIEIKKGGAGGGFYTVEYADGSKENLAWDQVKQFPKIEK